jgi:hypothetical protein
MTLMERYLAAVKKLLPRDERDDIARELAALLRAEMDERAAELGRPLDEDEQEGILRRHGHPALVAAQYRGKRGHFAFGREWIGPALFPLYTRILALNLCLTVLACVVAAVVLKSPPAGAFAAALRHLGLQFGLLTAIFSLANASLARFPNFRRSRRARSSRPASGPTR